VRWMSGAALCSTRWVNAAAIALSALVEVPTGNPECLSQDVALAEVSAAAAAAESSA